MYNAISTHLDALAAEGNLRSIPSGVLGRGCVDFSANDYLGLSALSGLQKEFLRSLDLDECWMMGASASRLLATRQKAYSQLENTIETAYADGRKALVFNSGYHANVGIVQALGSNSTVFIADRLVHASIIDGIRLSGAPFERFRHNDLQHLQRLLAKYYGSGKCPVIIVESVYSMDGDSPDLEALAALKERYGAMLYVDEAHAIGVEGRHGLGLAASLGNRVDISVGTFGKALASVGAYALCSPTLRQWLVNSARSFIFSTALPPISAMWNSFIFTRMLGMDSERQQLKALAAKLAEALGTPHSGHIQALMIGDPVKAVESSNQLKARGYLVLPIRKPTVPAGTDRLRISLSAAMSTDHIAGLASAINQIKNEKQ